MGDLRVDTAFGCVNSIERVRGASKGGIEAIWHSLSRYCESEIREMIVFLQIFWDKYA